MTGGKQLVSIRFLDQFKLYEDQSGRCPMRNVPSERLLTSLNEAIATI